MSRSIPPRDSLNRLVPALVVLGLLIANSASASPRTWQPLILKGAQMQELLGARIADLETLAMRNGVLAPIPFQVDQRRRDGTYVLPDGPYPTAAAHPGILGPNDELVMMISDMGARAGADTPGMPSGALEVRLSDPLGGPARYAYVASSPRPRLSTTRYVIFDPVRQRIETPHYRVSFKRALPNDFALQDRMFSNAPNLLQGFQILVRARIFKVIPFHLTQRDVTNHVLAWKEGPIRILRRLSHSVKLVLGIRSPQVTSDDFFYRDYLDNPFTVKFPWVPSVVFGDIYVRTDVEFVGVKDFKLTWSQMTGAPITIGDRVQERRLEDMNPPPVIQWVALSGGNRVIVQALKPSPDLQIVRPRLFYRDGPDPGEPFTPADAHPRIGYVMTGWRRLSSGSHTVDSLLVSAGHGYGSETIVKELGTPPSVRVRPVAAPSLGAIGLHRTRRWASARAPDQRATVPAVGAAAAAELCGAATGSATM